MDATMNNQAVAQKSDITLQSKERFLNRELSWLRFNRRVMEEAQNPNHPLLERIRFLSISAANLDEFFMVRVAGLVGQVEAGIIKRSPDGLTPFQQLETVRDHANDLMRSQRQVWVGLKAQLAEAGIEVMSRADLSRADKDWVRSYFREHVFPLLTPMAVDPAHPFPFIPNLGFSMVLQLSGSVGGAKVARKALMPMPNMMDRFVRIPGEATRFILLDDVISECLDEVFPDFKIERSAWFRIIRDTEIEVDEGAEDLVRTFQTALKKRIHGEIVRLSVTDMPDDLLQMIMDEMECDPKNVVRHGAMLGLSETDELVRLDRPELLFRPFIARFPERVRELNGDIFEAIRRKDFVVHHPYESFDVVVQFIRQAARDPNVVAVKQTLYRTSNDSPIVAALVQAAEAGKSVTAMVELKARFDEEANIRWARDLERAGVNVVFGFVDKKTHAKISLVVRREGESLRTYTHFGTGNYHPNTARVYTDLSFFTDDPAICRDAAQIFNFMTGYTEPRELEKLSVAPLNLRETLVEHMEAEIENAKAGRPAMIWAKMNSLVDPDIIDELYRASMAGVRIELVVRGICCLRPGVPGLSDNISVKSIVGRFLEHSRIIVFGNGHALPSPNAKVFISSADWMGRNLSGRVEVLVPIENPTVHQQVLEQVMVANLMDSRQSWNMNADGTYTRESSDEHGFCAHTYFMTNPSLSGRGSALEQHRPAMPMLVADSA
jgi:polyphosphate kinase